jgi:hypothetical protein
MFGQFNMTGWPLCTRKQNLQVYAYKHENAQTVPYNLAHPEYLHGVEVIFDIRHPYLHDI